VPFVEALIAAGADVNEKSNNGNSVLKNAIEKGDPATVSALLAAGADPEVTDNDRRPALHMAVKLGHIEIVKMLLDANLLWPDKHGAGANINAKDWEDDTPLTLAAMYDQPEIATLLVERGIELRDRKKSGFEAIHCAAEKGSLRVLDLLLDKGVDKLTPTASGRTLIHVASGFGQAPMLAYLMDDVLLDCNQTTQVQKGKPITDKWTSHEPKSRNQKCWTEISGNVVTSGCNPDTVGAKAWATRACAPLRTDRQLVYTEFVVLEGENPCVMSIGVGKDNATYATLPGMQQETYGYFGHTGSRLLGTWSSQEQYGPKYGKGDIIGLVWNRAFNTISFTRNGQHLGIAARDVPAAGMSAMVGLSQGGISVHANFGTAPYYFNMDDLLVEEESRQNPGNKEPWRFKEKTYPIHLAACSKSIEVLQQLLTAGAVVDQADADKWTAMHFAALGGWHEGMRLLLTYGANPNAETAHGSTPLMFAVKHSHTAASRVLLEAQASISVIDKDKRTLLMWAASTGNIEIMQMLIDRDMPIKAKDELGKTAMQYACNEAVVDFLEAALNKILIYRHVFEINLQSEVKRGAEGTVVMAKHVTSGNAVAIKFHKHLETRDYSASVLARLSRKYVAALAPIKAEEAIFDDRDKYPDAPYALVCDGGDKDLYEILEEQGTNPLPENQCRYIFECMAGAVQHMHLLDLVHHDLKAKNFVRFFDGRYRLVDFDNTRTANEGWMGNTTLEICAPEMAVALLRNERLHSATSMDIWALGCVLYQMVTQRLLLADLKPEWKGEVYAQPGAEGLRGVAGLEQAVVDRVLGELLESKKSSRLVQHAGALLRTMLQVDPRKRAAIDDVVMHSFLKGGNTAAQDEEALNNIRDTLSCVSDKVDAVLERVVAIDERTLALADLPAALQEGLADIGRRIHGLGSLVMEVANKAECPTTFVITPEAPATRPRPA